MTDRQRHDCAVALCCDRSYLYLALFMVWKIARHNSHRRFALAIASMDELALPDWAKSRGIEFFQTGALGDVAEVARFRGSLARLDRLGLVRGDLGKMMLRRHRGTGILHKMFNLFADPYRAEI